MQDDKPTAQTTDTERRWAAEDRAREVVKAAFSGFTNPAEAYLLWQRTNPLLMRGLLTSISEALEEAARAKSA